jgi:hypothetical protein
MKIKHSYYENLLYQYILNIDIEIGVTKLYQEMVVPVDEI